MCVSLQSCSNLKKLPPAGMPTWLERTAKLLLLGDCKFAQRPPGWCTTPSLGGKTVWGWCCAGCGSWCCCCCILLARCRTRSLIAISSRSLWWSWLDRTVRSGSHRIQAKAESRTGLPRCPGNPDRPNPGVFVPAELAADPAWAAVPPTRVFCLSWSFPSLISMQRSLSTSKQVKAVSSSPSLAS